MPRQDQVQYFIMGALVVGLLIYLSPLHSLLEYLLEVEEEEVSLKLQTAKKSITLAVNPNHRLQDCGSRKPIRFHGQGHEDKGLWTKFFKEPQICNGTFIELGALNGKSISNTLMFERDLGWNGILIEASPTDGKALLKNRPNVHSYNLAICAPGQKEVEFKAKHAVGGIVGEMNKHHMKYWGLDKQQTVKVACSTLGELVRFHGYTHIDFLSLDVEGAEFTVLKTIDWTVPIRVIMIEMNNEMV